MKYVVTILLLAILATGCIKTNPLNERAYSTGKYKYSLILNWTGQTWSSSIVDTIYADAENLSLLVSGEEAGTYFVAYRNGSLVSSKIYTEKLHIEDDCNVPALGTCYGRSVYFENGTEVAQHCLWKPYGQDEALRLYSEFPFNSDLLDLSENQRVWNVFEFNRSH